MIYLDKPSGGAAASALFRCFLLIALLSLMPAFCLPVMAEERIWLDIRAEAVEGSESVNDQRWPEFPLNQVVNGEVYVRCRVERKIISGLPAADSGRVRTVLGQPFSDSPRNHIPGAVIDFEGERYGLKSYETIPVRLEGRTAEVKKQIVYEGLGAEEAAPQTARLEVRDPVTGGEHSVVMPLLSSECTNARWEDRLYLRAVVEDCGAGVFQLGNALVEIRGEEPDIGLGTALTDSLGLSRDCCRVTEISWDGPAYEINGTACRRLTARGRRLVRDCQAVYGGTAALSPLDGQQIQAVYTKLDPVREAGNEHMQEADGSKGRRIVEYTAVYERPGTEGENYMTRDDMKQGAGRFIPGALAVLFSVGLIVCCAAAIRADCDYRQGQEAYEAVRAAANAVSGAGPVRKVPVLAAAVRRAGGWTGMQKARRAGGWTGMQKARRAGGWTGMPEKAGRAGAWTGMPEKTSQAERQRRAATAEEEGITLPCILEEPLREINREYCFWLYIPGTQINYPVVRHLDNQFYLTHRFDGGEGKCGSLFADCGEGPFSGAETFVYGHNMKDGSMFADLKCYLDEDFRAEHGSVYVYYRGAWEAYAVESCAVADEGAVGGPAVEPAVEPVAEPATESDRAGNRTADQTANPTTEGQLRPQKLTLLTCHGKGQRLVVRTSARAAEEQS